MSPTAKKTHQISKVSKCKGSQNSRCSQKTIHTRWASTTSKWSYDPYESGVVTLLFGLITLLITSRGPPSRALRINDVIPVFLSCFFFIFVDFSGFPENSPGFVSSIKNMIQQKKCAQKSCPGVDMDAIPSPLSRSLQCLVWKPQGIITDNTTAPNLWDYRLEWLGISRNYGWNIMGGLIWDEEMPKDDVLEKKSFLFKYGDFAQPHTFIEIPNHFPCEGL